MWVTLFILIMPNPCGPVSVQNQATLDLVKELAFEPQQLERLEGTLNRVSQEMRALQAQMQTSRQQLLSAFLEAGVDGYKAQEEVQVLSALSQEHQGLQKDVISIYRQATIQLDDLLTKQQASGLASFDLNHGQSKQPYEQISQLANAIEAAVTQFQAEGGIDAIRIDDIKQTWTAVQQSTVLPEALDFRLAVFFEDYHGYQKITDQSRPELIDSGYQDAIKRFVSPLLSNLVQFNLTLTSHIQPSGDQAINLKGFNQALLISKSGRCVVQRELGLLNRP